MQYRRILALGVLAPLAAAFVLAAAAPASAAGPCDGAYATATGNQATNFGFTSEEKSGCTAGVPSGAATMCDVVVGSTNLFSNFFRATWPNASARTMDAVGGCSFMCATGGNCRVGNDGLPVELLQFGVE